MLLLRTYFSENVYQNFIVNTDWKIVKNLPFMSINCFQISCSHFKQKKLAMIISLDIDWCNCHYSCSSGQRRVSQTHYLDIYSWSWRLRDWRCENPIVITLSVYQSVCPHFVVILNNSNNSKPRDLMLHYWMEDKDRKTPIDFWVKRSKVKVKATNASAGPSLIESVF